MRQNNPHALQTWHYHTLDTQKMSMMGSIPGLASNYISSLGRHKPRKVPQSDIFKTTIPVNFISIYVYALVILAT